MTLTPSSFTLFPYTTLFRSHVGQRVVRLFVQKAVGAGQVLELEAWGSILLFRPDNAFGAQRIDHARSEEHTSELQSHSDIVCRLLLEKKKTIQQKNKNTQTQ